MTPVWLNQIGTAVPPHDIHAEFVDFARAAQPDTRTAALFARMASLADIEHRYAIFAPGPRPRDVVLDAEGFYRRGAFPGTAARMARYREAAPGLALQAIGALGLGDDRGSITHLIVASCTGFSAPGLDLAIQRGAGLRDSVERTIVGFMGCFAAVNALRLARHIVRSEPDARVLVVNVELSSLHLREDFRNIPAMLSFLLFGDGASACLVSAEPVGLLLGGFESAIIPETGDLITWDIGDQGFEMRLSGQVPARIRRCLAAHADRPRPANWAVHAGGRTILDAVQQALDLPPAALRHSRAVLRDIGNVSSATLVFVLQRILRDPDARGDGIAMAFGPGLSMESFGFRKP